MANQFHSSQDIMNKVFDSTSGKIRTVNVGGGGGGVQSDWSETDSTSLAYIKNKPTIPEAITVDSELSSTSTNPLQNKAIYSALQNAGAKEDNSSIVKNQSGQIQAVGLKETNSSTTTKIWVGTKAEYEAQNKSSSDDLCYITDDEDSAEVVTEVKFSGSSTSLVSGGVATIPVDSSLSDSSTNPIQNAAVKQALDSKISSPSSPVVGQYLKKTQDGWETSEVTSGVSDVTVNGTSVLDPASGVASVQAITGIKLGGVPQTPVDGVMDLFPAPPTPTYGSAWGVLIPPTSDTALVKVEVTDGVLSVVQSFSNTNFSEWVGCVYDIPNKQVKYYLDPEDWSKKYFGTYHGVTSDGSASDLTGTDGDVLVEIPKTYSLYGTVASGDYANYTYVLFGASAFQFQNRTAEADNAFMVGTTSETLPKSYVYHAAYEGVLCDSSGQPVESGNPPGWVDGYKIRSISGGKVFTNANQAIMELGYRNAGWHGANWAIGTFIMRAMMIYYGTRDLQSSPLGVGFAYASSWNYSYTRLTGRGNSLGNGSGPIAFDSTLDSGISWVSGADSTMKKVGCKFLGIENPYGHIWKFQFGLYKDSNTTYRYTLNPDEHPTTTAALTAAESGQVMYSNSVNFSWPTQSGVYIKQLDFHAVLPTEVGGSSSTYFCDYYWYASGPRCVFRGGCLGDGAFVGPFCLIADRVVSIAYAGIGGFGSL